MLSQEILWESLHSMHRFQQKYKQTVFIHEFLLDVISTLSNHLDDDPFELVIERLQRYFQEIDCFILEILNDDYGKVIKSTQPQEIKYLWPLIGPFKRVLNAQPSIVFNAKLIPVLRVFPPVVTHQISSMIMSTFELNQLNLMLIITQSKVGGLTMADQNLLDEVTQLMSQQEDRFRFTSITIPQDNIEAKDPNNFTTNSIKSRYKNITPTIDHDLLNTNTTAHIKKNKVNNVRHLPLTEGDQLADRYTIINLLGQGGQASVYHCHDLLINRSVAIKIATLMNIQPSQSQVDQLIREASLAANIQHPNVVQIYDIGFHSDERIPFIVMEYLIGVDLRERLTQRGLFVWHHLIPLMIPVLEALGEAHLSNLVHRDLKPHNLFLVHEDTPQEQIRILDFGIAQLLDHPKDAADSISGTLAYLAPEYLRDQTVSPQVDVYQMGLILIELLSGQKVFNSESSYKLMLDIIDGNFDMPSSIAHEELRRILNKATQVDPKKRYANGHVFAAELTAFIQRNLPREKDHELNPAIADNYNATQVDSTQVDSTRVDSTRVDSTWVDYNSDDFE